jgi:hypothetical protein
VLSTEQTPAPLPPMETLLLHSPLYIPYSLSEVEEAVKAEEQALDAVVRAKAPPPIPTVGGYSEAATLAPAPAQYWREKERVQRLRGSGAPLSSYCVGCQRERVFHPARVGTGQVDIPDPVDDQYITRQYYCAWNAEHHLRFVLRVVRTGAWTVTKVGQFPPLADLMSGDLQRYRKVLSDQDDFELNRAVGLAAHGIGVGAFVYLRRIFERLLEEAHRAALTGVKDWDEKAYQQERTVERIGRLAQLLPVAVVTNRHLYGILSTGLHDLSENECKAYFPVVLAGIEAILEEQLADTARRARAAQTAKAVASLARELRNAAEPAGSTGRPVGKPADPAAFGQSSAPGAGEAQTTRAEPPPEITTDS